MSKFSGVLPHFLVTKGGLGDIVMAIFRQERGPMGSSLNN